MSEKERNNWQETRSKLEKAGKIAALTGTLAVVAGCTGEGEPVPTIEEAVGPEPTPAEIQVPESVEQGEIKVTQEAFTGSMIEETQDLTLESTQTLDLGVEKTQAIVTEAKEMGLDPEEITYTGFYKVDETGNRELVVILSTPSKEKEGMKDLYYVSGREGDKYVPVGVSSQIELLEMREYEKEGSSTTLIGFETESEDLLPVMELTEQGSFYIDPYTRVMTRMNEELSSEIQRVISSTPEGTGELINRLGEEAKVVMNESGKYDLVYNETVIGELDNEKQISFQVEEETVSISTESLVVKDGVLVSINQQRTEEMGVDWVEQVWSIGGERVAVPEPQILLPEIYEETLVVKEEALDYFMPKLLAAEKKYLDENGWGENDLMPGLPSLKDNTGLPWAYREIDIGARGEGASDYDVLVTSWTRIEMEDGRKIDSVGIPFKADRPEFGSRRGESFVWHFAFDEEATTRYIEEKWGNNPGNSEEYIQEIVGRYKMENVFEGVKEGKPMFTIRMFVDTGNIEGMEEFEREQRYVQFIRAENMEKLLERLDERIKEHSILAGGEEESYSDLWGREMVSYGSRSDKPKPNPPEWFGEVMEQELIPCYSVYVFRY